MIHLTSFITSLKVGCIRRLFNEAGNWIYVTNSYFNTITLANTGHEKKNRKSSAECSNPFWKDVLLSW